MIIGIPEILLILALFVLPIACITNWIAALQQWQSGEPLVPTEYEQNVPWGLVDLGMVVAIVGLVAGLGVQVVGQSMGIEEMSLTEMTRPADQGKVFLIFGTGTLLAMVLSLAWVRLRYRRIDGFSARHVGDDLELGIRWFVMLVVPVLLTQLLLTRWFPSRHPLVEMLRLTKNLSMLPIAAYAAMIAAPFFEEVFFRLFLQGWLEKLQVTATRVRLGVGSKADTDAVLLGGESSASLLTDDAPKVDGQATDDGNPYRAPSGNGSSARLELGEDGVEATQHSKKIEEREILWVPILVSSGLFALAHVQHGPDWVPLFFLALGLGYLYQRTRRIVPCIVVHMLVNGLGILQLWSAIRQ